MYEDLYPEIKDVQRFFQNSLPTIMIIFLYSFHKLITVNPLSLDENIWA